LEPAGGRRKSQRTANTRVKPWISISV
jgi:hypothetical protein